MSIQFAERLRSLQRELDEVKRQIVELQADKSHVVNCAKVMDLVKDVEKRKPGRPPKHG